MTVLMILLLALCLVSCLASGLMEPRVSEPRRDMSRYVSDEEFLAACSVKDPQIAFKVREVLCDALGLDEHNIHPDDRIIQDLGAY